MKKKRDYNIFLVDFKNAFGLVIELACAEAASKPNQIFRMKLSEKIVKGSFRKEFNLGCLTGFWIHLWCESSIFIFQL